MHKRPNPLKLSQPESSRLPTAHPDPGPGWGLTRDGAADLGGGGLPHLQ